MIFREKVVTLIPTYERWHSPMFQRCLRSYKDLGGRPDVPVVIYDDGSCMGKSERKPMFEWIRGTLTEFDLNGTVCVGDRNRGIGYARHHLVEIAQEMYPKAEAYFFLDDDVYLRKNCIPNALKTLDKYRDAGLVGVYGSYRRFHGNITKPFEIGATGTAFAVRTSVFKNCSFDEKMKNVELTDFCIQLWLDGWRVLVDPKADVYHVRSQKNTTGKGHNIGGMAMAKNADMGFWNRYIARKYPNVVKADRNSRLRYMPKIREMRESGAIKIR